MNLALRILMCNAPEATANAARSSGLPPERVIVVSNGSCDEADAALRRALPQATIVPLRPARSIAYCMNLGLRLPVEQGWDPLPEWTVLSNDDIEFDPDWLEKLEDCMEENPKALQVNMAYPHHRYACFAMHRDLVGAVGWWDERFPGMLYEDEDWHLRLSEYCGDDAARLHERHGRRDMVLAMIQVARHDETLRAADRARYGFTPNLSPEPNRGFFLEKWRRTEHGGWVTKGKIDHMRARYERVLPEEDPYPREMLTEGLVACASL